MTSPEPTTAPVTEDLRDRIAAAVRRELVELHDDVPASLDVADAVVAALAGDPADLPARMHTAMSKAVVKWAALDIDERRGTEFSTFLTVSAMSVRWENAAALAAENARLRAALEESQGNASAYHEHMVAAQADRDRHRAGMEAASRRAELADVEVERLRAELAKVQRQVQGFRGMKDTYLRERNATHADLTKAEEIIERLCNDREAGQQVVKAAITEQRQRAEQAEADARGLLKALEAERHTYVTWQQRAEQAEAERDLLRETLAESDLGAQVLAQWEAIAAADADRDRLEAERNAALAAVRTAQITHIRETHPDRMHHPDCGGCWVFLGLSRDLPSRPDDPEEIRRLAESTETET